MIIYPTLEAYEAKNPEHGASKSGSPREKWWKAGWFWNGQIATYGKDGEDGALPQTSYCQTDAEARFRVEKHGWMPLWAAPEKVIAMLRAFYVPPRKLPAALAEGLREWEERNKPARTEARK